MGWPGSKSESRNPKHDYNNNVETLSPLDARRLRLHRDSWEYVKKTFSRCCPHDLTRLDPRAGSDPNSVFVRCEPDIEIIVDLLVNELRRTRQMVQSLSDEVNIQHAAANSCRDQYDTAQRQLELRKAQHVTELSEEQTRHKIEVADLHADYQRRGLELIGQHKDEISDLQIKAQQSEYDLITRHDGIVSEMEYNYGSTIRDMSSRHADQEKTIREDYEQRLSQNVEEYELRLSQMAKDYELREQRFVEEVDGLSAALIDQDNSYQANLGSSGEIQRLGDDLVKDRYQELLQYTEKLVRIDWKDEQTVWTDQQLYDLGSHQTLRKLKNNILEDTIWLHLNRYIFCSPFRVFGDEGEGLDKRWSERYGRDDHLRSDLYTWPRTGIEAERWRYETIRECRMALMQPTSPHDPRAKLKRGFKTSTENLKSTIKSTLNELVYLSQSDVETVDALVLRAANIWLEFGMQRYRIMLSLPGSTSQPLKERVRTWRAGTLLLTTAPTLKRYGNAKGYDLGRPIIVAGCEGRSLELHGYGSIPQSFQ